MVSRAFGKSIYMKRGTPSLTNTKKRKEGHERDTWLVQVLEFSYQKILRYLYFHIENLSLNIGELSRVWTILVFILKILMLHLKNNGTRTNSGIKNMITIYCKTKNKNKKQEQKESTRSSQKKLFKIRIPGCDTCVTSPAHLSSNVVENTGRVLDFFSRCHSVCNMFFNVPQNCSTSLLHFLRCKK